MGRAAAALLLVVAAIAEVPARQTPDVASVIISAESPADPWTRWANVTVTWTVTTTKGDDSDDDGNTVTEDDWVGAFLADWPATYIKWQPANSSANGSTPGAATGSTVFRLLNARHSYTFKYFRGDTVLAESNEVEPLGRTPLQGHLSLVPGVSDAMALVWVSNSSEPQAVRWGTSASSLDHETTTVATDTIASHEFTDCMQVPPAPARSTPFANLSIHDIRCTDDCYNDSTAPELYLDPGFIHTAVLSPLPPPGTRTYYAFGEAAAFERQQQQQQQQQRRPSTAASGGAASTDAAVLALSATFSFVAPRPPGDRTPFTFLVTADAGIGAVSDDEKGGATHNDPPVNGADQVWAAIQRSSNSSSDEFLVLNGDLSYARGWPWIWERFFDVIEPIATALPFMPTVGNHEVDTKANSLALASGHDSGGECGVATVKRFPSFPSLDRMYYSFSYGSVHSIMLSTEHEAAEQLAWLEADMAALNRSATPWVLVYLHRPLFGSNARDELDVKLADEWHSVFVKHAVDLVLCGHQHFYERLCQVESEEACATDRDRPVYIIDGSAGAECDPAVDPHRPSNISLYRDYSKWGYSRVAIDEQQLTFTHYHVDNLPYDSVSLPSRQY
jgi:hypothetical protein